MKDWFKARNLWGGMILNLSDAEAGRLCKALWRFTMTGEQTELSGAEKAIFPMLVMTLRQDEEREQELSSKRSQAGSQGGRPKANASFEKQKKQMLSEKANALKENQNKNQNREQEEEPEQEKESKEKSGRSLSLADGFDMFWAAYPRHTAKDVARKSWGRLNPSSELVKVILSAIDRQKTSAQWTRDNGQFIPHPATWLNQHRWEDELPSAQPVNAFAAYVERMEREGIA